MSVYVDHSKITIIFTLQCVHFVRVSGFVAYSYVNYYCNLNYLIPIVIILFFLLSGVVCHCIYIFQLLKYVKDTSGI